MICANQTKTLLFQTFKISNKRTKTEILDLWKENVLYVRFIYIILLLVVVGCWKGLLYWVGSNILERKRCSIVAHDDDDGMHAACSLVGR
jgi:uncharacterized membrane protein